MDKKKKKIVTWWVIGGIATTLCVAVFIFAFIVTLFGPELFHRDRYRGEHPHLYTVAVNSLLTRGRISGLETYHASEIIKVDEDDYGRELFIYEGSPVAFGEEYHGARSVLICQKHDDKFAYWYDCDNFILAPHYGKQEERDNGVEEDPYKGITAEQIAQLKEKNDWGKAVDESKLSRAKIVREPLYKYVGSKAEDAKSESFYNALFAEDGYNYWSCNSVLRDKDGRAVYYINGQNKDLDYTSAYKWKYIIAITSPDGEFYEDGWFIYDSPKTYAESLKRIKQATGWNMQAA